MPNWKYVALCLMMLLFSGGGLAYAQERVTRVYDISDFTLADAETDVVRDIIALVQDTIRPFSWKESRGTGTAVAGEGAELVVEQTVEVHDMVERLLMQLRETSRPPVTISCEYWLVDVANVPEHWRTRLANPAPLTSEDQSALRVDVPMTRATEIRGMAVVPIVSASMAVQQPVTFLTGQETVNDKPQPRRMTVRTGAKLSGAAALLSEEIVLIAKPELVHVLKTELSAAADGAPAYEMPLVLRCSTELRGRVPVDATLALLRPATLHRGDAEVGENTTMGVCFLVTAKRAGMK